MSVYCKITKTSDNKFEGNQPNGVNVNYTRIGELIFIDNIEHIDRLVGMSCVVHHGKMRALTTSPITEIVEKNEKYAIFKTLNSTYKVEVMEREN